MPKQNVRNGRLAKILRQENALATNKTPNQRWDDEKKVWVKL